MNIQTTVSSQFPGETAVDICLCENPDTVLPGAGGRYCSVCGGMILSGSVKASEKIPVDELLDIRDAKENIRNTLTLQKKRKQDRAGELDFLLRRL